METEADTATTTVDRQQGTQNAPSTAALWSPWCLASTAGSCHPRRRAAAADSIASESHASKKDEKDMIDEEIHMSPSLQMINNTILFGFECVGNQ